jgi:hypothetical protein
MNLSEAQAIFGRTLAPLPVDEFLRDAAGRHLVALQGISDRYGRFFLGEKPDETILKEFDEVSDKITWHAAESRGLPPKACRCNSAASFRDQIRSFHKNGYTVRIPNVRSFDTELNRFVRAMEMIFQVPVDATVFWSDADGAAPIHHDNYDLLVLQIFGRKRWFISTDRSAMPNRWQVIPDGPARLGNHSQFDIETGDFLYLPRGTNHRVEGLDESIHISIGFTPLTVGGAINACIDQLSDMSLSLREIADAEMASHLQIAELGTLGQRIREGIGALLQHCGDDRFILDAMQRRSSKVVGDLPMLSAPREAPEISLDTRLRHNPIAISHLSGNERLIDFAYPGSHRYLHRGAEVSVAFIAQCSEFTVREVPGPIDDMVRVALVRQFVVNGFLEVVSQ